jgi:hypothetical protein
MRRGKGEPIPPPGPLSCSRSWSMSTCAKNGPSTVEQGVTVRGVAPQESLTSQRRNRVSPCDRVSYLPVPPGYFRPVGTRGRGTHLCTCCGRALELLGTANLPRRSAAVEANSVTAEPVFPRASGRVGRFRRRATFRRSAVLVTCCDLCLDAASTGWRGNPPAA